MAQNTQLVLDDAAIQQIPRRQVIGFMYVTRTHHEVYLKCGHIEVVGRMPDIPLGWPNTPWSVECGACADYGPRSPTIE